MTVGSVLLSRGWGLFQEAEEDYLCLTYAGCIGSACAVVQLHLCVVVTWECECDAHSTADTTEVFWYEACLPAVSMPTCGCQEVPGGLLMPTWSGRLGQEAA